MNKGQEDTGAYKTLTPEQKAKLKNFGKKNGLPEQKVQAQLSQTQTAPQPQVKVAPNLVAQKTESAAQPAAQPRQQTVQSLGDDQYQKCETYFSCQNEEAGTLEVDLVTFREKGLETRYLSLLLSGLDVRQNPPIQQEAFLTIESREEFERLKSFFAQLDWED